MDAFNEGTLLTVADCAACLRAISPELELKPEFLDPIEARQFLIRLLNNLLDIYVRGSRFGKALGVLEMLLCLEPEALELLRRRGVVHAQLKNYLQAITDLERCLAATRDTPDHNFLAKQLMLLHHLRGMIN